MCPKELGAVLYADIDSEVVPGPENIELPPLPLVPLYMNCWLSMLPMLCGPFWKLWVRCGRASCDPK